MKLPCDSEYESTTCEFKQIEKLKSSNDFDDILKIIVGMANRNGGHIYIGIKDSGEPQGKGIFECFSEGDRSGLDKIKEKINGKCLSNTSPIVEIDMNFISNDNYDILDIIIPKKKTIPHAVVKRTGNYIESRKYYIKTSHNCTLISDSQLEWLFNSKEYEDEVEYYNVQATTYKLMGGIPISSDSGKQGDWQARGLAYNTTRSNERSG
ncbi:ATP-binding protein [Shewanella insulae]|uniref:AlbA family DNA-binding domain-containing protein n=1 Tax=Shewanella insulae TaxID=2681496 RepID=UPI001EFC5ED6|nr:ATP-binding protein [Shewanella insulae]MCG9754505.1 ATP-binding protein [Shewanella insulae]